MLLAGIVGHTGKAGTANLINLIFSSKGKRVSIVDSRILAGLSPLQVKSYVMELDRNDTDVLIFKINASRTDKSIFENLNFDVVIYVDRADELLEADKSRGMELMRVIFSSLSEKCIVIVNADDTKLIQFLQDMKYYVVTYGFNNRASITTSSIGDTVFEDGFMCCLQKAIPAKNGTLMEPQEYRIRLETNEMDAYDVLAAASFAIVNGVNLNNVAQNATKY